jgi:hypothetical protein
MGQNHWVEMTSALEKMELMPLLVVLSDAHLMVEGEKFLDEMM